MDERKQVKPGTELSALRKAFAPKRTRSGYQVRPLSESIKWTRAALYNLYFDGDRDDRGETDVIVHNYMAHQIGTFLPVEFEESIRHLEKQGLAVSKHEADGTSRYRLTTAGQMQEELERMSWPRRQWAAFVAEAGVHMFWLAIGVVLTLLTVWLERLVFLAR